MPRFRYILLGLAAALLLAALAAWPLLRTDAVWTWGGHRLADMARSRIYGEIDIREIKGNHLTGLTFKGVTVKGRQGEVLRAARVELRFSLWSLVKLQPVIARLAIIEPHLTLREDRDGRWNVSNFLRATPPPPFHTIDLSQAVIQNGEITLTRSGETQVYRNLDLQLVLTILHPKQPDQAILVRRAILSGETPWGPLRAQTRFTYGSSLLNLLSLSLEKRNLPLVALAGEIRFREGEPQGRIAGEIGPITAAEIRRYWEQWPDAYDLEGRFQVAGTASQLQLTGEGSLPQGGYSFQVQLQRHLGDWEYDLALNLTRLQPGAWLAGGNAWAARLKDLSPLTLRLNLKGAGPPQAPRRLEGAFTCEPFAYRAARVEQFHLTLKGDHREQRLEGLLKGNFGRVEAAMTGPLLSGTGGAVKIQARELQPGLLGLAVESGSQVSGQFSGNFRLPASLSGNLEARGQWGRLPVKDLKARLSLHGRKLEVAQAQAQLGTLAVDFKGTVDPRGLDLQGKGSLALDGSWPALPTNLRGRLTGEAALKGPFAGPQFHLQAQGQDLAWGDFAWSRLTLKASGTAWPPASGRLEIQGTGLKTPAGVFSQVSLHSQGEGGRWQVRGAASSPEGLEAGMQGAAHLSARPFGITLERCRFRSPKVDLANTGPVTISFSPGLEMAPATFKVNDGRLLIRARTQGDGLTARLEAVDLPAGLFSLKGAELEGKIQGGLDLSGSLQHPSLQGQITWGPGKWGNFAFRSLQTGITYREESLVLRGGVEEKPEGPRLVWDGRIPLKLSFSPLGWAWGERDMDFRVQGERASLALLTALTPEVEKAEGSLSIMAQWQGNPGRPRVSGQLRWGEGTLQLRQAGRPFKLHGAAATLQGNKLVIPELALESGGMARVQGAITLAAFSPQHLDLRAQLQDFQALSRGGAEASASGLVTLSGPVSALVLKGRLLVSKASFRPSFFRTGIHPDIVLVKPPQAPGAKLNQKEELALWKNLQMDLVLDTDGGARIHDKRLKLELAGSLKVQKKPGGKAYTGGVLRTLKGTYELQGRPFKVERGEIRFPGKPGGEVTIEGRASHEFSGITMILIASGPANKPQVRMESVPPLPPQDLLAYLVFGRPAQTLTKEEYATVGQQALGILGGVTAKKIQEFLGADFPLVGNVSLKSGQEQGRQIVGIAKPITKDITVSFERKTSPLYRDDSTQVRLEYRYNKYLSVESQMGRRNTGADVLFNLDF